MISIILNLIQRFQEFVLWLWRQDGTASQRARGVAIGVFSGCFPFFGFQTILGIYLGNVFRANLLLAACFTWISNPFTYLPLYWFNYKVGMALLGEHQDLQSLNQYTSKGLWDHGWLFISRILLGSSVVGIILGVTSGMIFYFLFKSFSMKKIRS